MKKHPDGQSIYLTPATDAVSAESTDWQDLWDCSQGQEIRARTAEAKLALAIEALKTIAVGNGNWARDLAEDTLFEIVQVEES